MPARVIVLGGGVGGMSAAHELIERGFEVVVLEERDIAGGKARSVPVEDDGEGTRGRELADKGIASITDKIPGEHGFRFFPGFYKHVIDTMRRTPSFDDRTVADHLVPTTRVGLTQYDRPMFQVPAMFPRTTRDAGTLLRDTLLLFGPTLDISPEEFAFFGARYWQLLTSCSERRLAEYEKTSWWDFIGAAQRSPAYQKFLAVGFTRSLVAAKANKASARTVGDMFVQMMMTIVNPSAGTTDRVLDAPTNLAWIDPWRSHLESRGVQFVMEAKVERLLSDGGQVVGVVARKDGAPQAWRGDFYVSALPVERMAALIDAKILAVDPALGNLRALASNTEWMNGIQFYLKRDAPICHGHVIHVDTEWALTSISQVQFWRSLSPEQFDDRDVKGVLSVDISDWTSPGLNGRCAMDCTRDEVMRETWAQLKRSLNSVEEVLRDEDLHSWFLDPDIGPAKNGQHLLRNGEPLLVNLENTWALRPEASTGVPNLFLASDYVRTHTDLATMEGANEAARRAVNGLLDRAGYAGPRCEIWPLYEPKILAPWRLYDAERFRAGLPWDATLVEVAARALSGSGALDLLRPLIEKATPFVAPVAAALDPPAKASAAAEQSNFGTAPLETLLVAAPSMEEQVVGPGGFVDRIVWYREMIAGAMSAAVPKGEPQRHLYALVDDFLGRSGKGLRPALCIATARALGGRGEDAAHAAAGLEMLHNAFLVHDDIEDESETRRGHPTMHRRVGVPIAVNAGDAMNALSMRLFRKAGERLGPAGALRMLEEVDHLLVETLEGQAMELGWVRDNELTVGPQDYMRLVLKKTAWYSFIHPMRIGALVANGEDRNLGRFDGFGFLIGLAFQITDDVLNLNGSPARYGKEIEGDLFEGKRTLLLTHALAHASRADRDWIAGFLGRPRERRRPSEVFRLRQIIESAGSLAWAQQAARVFAQAAASQFDEMAFAGVKSGPDLDWLRRCVDFVVGRDA
jgi:geranylgeranyl pyrophosphate synthase/uncharacterized protein with NAD-binding domain and iron-sulfur cluster